MSYGPRASLKEEWGCYIESFGRHGVLNAHVLGVVAEKAKIHNLAGWHGVEKSISQIARCRDFCHMEPEHPY